MIAVRIGAGRFAAGLEQKARRLGEAHVEARARRADPARWRAARLLWPLFAKER